MIFQEIPTVFVTGASGVVGSALLRELDDVQHVCLRHHAAVPSDRACTLTGDLSQPWLGLRQPQFRALARRVDAIVHCAAVTDFSADSRTSHAINVAGTENVLELAAAADVPVYHLSTAFVDRHRTHGTGGSHAYLESKREAERRVVDSGIPAVIIRPSILVGDSQTGEITEFQGLNVLAGALLRNSLPILPIPHGALIDFVPQDLVASSVAALVRHGERNGEYWITAGSEAPSVDRLVELCGGFARDLGRDVIEPRLVDQDFIDRLMRPAFLGEVSAKLRWRFDQMVEMTRLLNTPEPFPSSLDRLARRFSIRLPSELETIFLRCLRFWAQQKGLASETMGVSG